MRRAAEEEAGGQEEENEEGLLAHNRLVCIFTMDLEASIITGALSTRILSIDAHLRSPVSWT